MLDNGCPRVREPGRVERFAPENRILSYDLDPPTAVGNALGILAPANYYFTLLELGGFVKELIDGHANA